MVRLLFRLGVLHLHMTKPMMQQCRVWSQPTPAAAAARLHCRRLQSTSARSHSRVQCCGSALEADVAIIDAQNVLSRAHADHRRGCRLAGETAASSFADWLQFLQAVTSPRLMVAVFDAPAAKRGVQQRQLLSPAYLQRRQRRKGQQAQHAQASSGRPAATAADSQAAGKPGAAAGDPLRPFKQSVRQLGGVCLEAANGWEADDGIAAACTAVVQRHHAARVVIASGDSDMQQLLSPQVRQRHRQGSCHMSI